VTGNYGREGTTEQIPLLAEHYRVLNSPTVLFVFLIRQRIEESTSSQEYGTIGRTPYFSVEIRHNWNQILNKTSKATPVTLVRWSLNLD